MAFCSISSSFVPRWTTLAPSGGPPHLPIWENCRCFSPSLITGKFTMICETPTLPIISDIWKIRLKVSWREEPLSYAVRRHFRCPSVDPGPLKLGNRDRQLVLATRKAAMSTLWIVSNWHFSITLTEGFPCFFLSCNANAKGIIRKDGARPALFPRKVSPRLIPPSALNLTIMDSNPSKHSSQSNVPPIRPLASCAMVLNLPTSRYSAAIGNL